MTDSLDDAVLTTDGVGTEDAPPMQQNPQDVFNNLIRKSLLTLDGFTKTSRNGLGVRVKYTDRAVLSVAKQMAVLQFQVAEMNRKIEAMEQSHLQVRTAIQQLSKNDVLIQTLSANVIFELLGRGGDWQIVFDIFQSIEQVDDTTVGAVKLHVDEDWRVEFYGQIPDENPDADADSFVWRKVPKQFLDGMQFHAVQAYMRKKDINLKQGESLYLTFTGSESFVSLIPEGYEDIDARIDEAAKEINEWSDELANDGAIKDGKVDFSAPLSEEEQTEMNRLFPNGVDNEGQPVDPHLFRAMMQVSTRQVDAEEITHGTHQQ